VARDDNSLPLLLIVVEYNRDYHEAMVAILKSRWFVLMLFAVAYVLSAAASVALRDESEPRCGSADCMLLLKMTQDSRDPNSTTAPLSR
jgi:hypothetical protein